MDIYTWLFQKFIECDVKNAQWLDNALKSFDLLMKVEKQNVKLIEQSEHHYNKNPPRSDQLKVEVRNLYEVYI